MDERDDTTSAESRQQRRPIWPLAVAMVVVYIALEILLIEIEARGWVRLLLRIGGGVVLLAMLVGLPSRTPKGDRDRPPR